MSKGSCSRDKGSGLANRSIVKASRAVKRLNHLPNCIRYAGKYYVPLKAVRTFNYSKKHFESTGNADVISEQTCRGWFLHDDIFEVKPPDGNQSGIQTKHEDEINNKTTEAKDEKVADSQKVIDTMLQLFEQIQQNNALIATMSDRGIFNGSTTGHAVDDESNVDEKPQKQNVPKVNDQSIVNQETSNQNDPVGDDEHNVDKDISKQNPGFDDEPNVDDETTPKQIGPAVDAKCISEDETSTQNDHGGDDDHNVDTETPQQIGPSVDAKCISEDETSTQNGHGGDDDHNVDTPQETPQQTVFVRPEDDETAKQKKFVQAFKNERIDTIQEIFASYTGYEVFKLTSSQFSSICHQVVKSKASKASVKLLKTVHYEAVSYLNETGNSYTNPEEAMTSILKELLKGLCCTKLGLVTCCRNCKIEESEKKTYVDELFMLSTIINNVDQAEVLWSECKNPMLTALAAYSYLKSMADMAENLYDEKLQKELLSHSKLFLSHAVTLLEKQFTDDEDKAMNALDYFSNVWGHYESPVHFAQQFQIEEFISHSFSQKYASRKLFSLNGASSRKQNDTQNREEPEIKILPYPININGLSSFIKHHWKNSKLAILTAPATRILFHIVFFLSALIMFSLFLVRNLEANSISLLEGMVFVYMLGDLVEEIWTMIGSKRERSAQRIFLHLFDIWNILDFLCFTLYILGFCLHMFDSDLLVPSRRVYSIALFIMFLRLLNLLLLTRRFGTIILMLTEMLVDLMEYLVILIIFIFAAGIVYHANVYPNHTVTGSSNIESWPIWTILKIPYWQVYGELYLDTFEASDESGCTNNATLWKNDPTVERCPTSDWITPVIAAFYMLLTNWLLLNIVIAMFSARFDEIQKTARQKWLYYRHLVVIDYEDRIPSPVNLPFRIFSLFRLAIKCQCTCCSNCGSTCCSSCGSSCCCGCGKVEDSSIEQKTKKKQPDMDENENMNMNMMKQQREYARATIAAPQHLNTF